MTDTPTPPVPEAHAPKRRGRPPKDDAQRANVRVPLVMTAREAADLDALCAAAGVNRSAWLKQAVSDAARRARRAAAR